MNNILNEIIRENKTNRPTYADMIKFCTDNNLILNNSIIEELTKKDFYFEPFCGTEYDEERDTYIDIFQYYIITENGADALARYTNELVLYNEELDLYLLCVTHYGTSWSYVPANWKDTTNEE